MLTYLIYAHIAAATLTTVVIFGLGYSERPQAVAQALVAWLIPLLGALFVLIFQSIVHRNMTTRLKPDSEGHYRDEGVAVDLYHEIESDD